MKYLHKFKERVIKDRMLPKDFFNPLAKNINDISLLGTAQLDKAVAMLSSNFTEGGKIVIYGDIDVDGIFSTHIAQQWIENYSNNVEHVYNKQTEKHGIIVKKIPQCDLLVILDSSSNDYTKMRELISAGIAKDILVIDHHEDINIDNSNPHVVLLNPYVKGCLYPNKKISNGLLTWKVLSYFESLDVFSENRIVDTDVVKDMLDLAVLTLVSDGMDLANMENRYYYYRGTGAFKNNGLRELMKFKDGSVENVIFGLTTLLNATIKKDKIDMIYQLLQSSDIAEIRKIVKEMNKLYKEKKARTQELIDTQTQLIAECETYMIVRINKRFKEFGKDVASKLQNYYSKNVIMLYKAQVKPKVFYGSGRGIDPNFKDKINKFGDYISCVGHQGAFGLYCHSVDELIKDMAATSFEGKKPYYDFALPADKIDDNLMTFTKTLNYLSDERSFKSIQYKVKNLHIDEKGASKASGNAFLKANGFRVEQWNDYWAKDIKVGDSINVIGQITKKSYCNSIFVEGLL